MSQHDPTSFITNAAHQISGGIHPPEHKEISNESDIAVLDTPNFYILPLSQINQNTKQLLGQKLIAGQLIESCDFNQIACLTHSPCDGTVEEISNFDLGHPSGFAQPGIKITANSQHPVSQLTQQADDSEKSPSDQGAEQLIEQQINTVHQAGIVGLGGAGFPTHIKLAVPDNKIHTLIVNGMECEPYITCDDRLLRESSQSILMGALLSANMVGASKILFGIEDNKPEAIGALKLAIEDYFYKHADKQKLIDIKIIIAKTKYPSGGEKQIIEILTGQQVPKGQLPSSLGLLVQNVATLDAIYKAVNQQQVMTQRLVTITGNLVDKPGNYWIPFGTPVSHIANLFNVDLGKLSCFIFGGPLMGERYSNLAIPTKKTTNCIIFDSSYQPLELPAKHQECIRCGECEAVCPMDLVPQQLYWFAKSEQWEALQDQQLFSCIDCAACSYVCPSKIPLVNYYQFAKSEIKDLKAKQIKSELAKTRFDNREKRLARLKMEREQKRKKAAEARKLAAANKDNDPDGKKSAIAAALQRVKDKKENKL